MCKQKDALPSNGEKVLEDITTPKNSTWILRFLCFPVKVGKFGFIMLRCTSYYVNWRKLGFWWFLNDLGDNNCTELAPGHYEFPFHFTLSRRIPPSFEGICGRVKYSVSAVIKRRLPKSSLKDEDDIVREIPFVVNVNKGQEIVTTYQSVCINISWNEINCEI